MRALLLVKSRELLDESGPSGLSMREVARRAGCTHQAPYHWFADRESLLAVLATEGFVELQRRTASSNDLAPTQGARATLIACGAAYLTFALENPGVFRLMFRHDVTDHARFPDLQQAATASYAELVRLAGIASECPPSAAFVTVLWSSIHGLAELVLDGPLASYLHTPDTIETHLFEVSEQFADLLLGAPRKAQH